MVDRDLKAWRETRAGLLLFLKVTPNASRDEIGDVVADAEGQGHLVVRVRAVPEKGKANKAVVKLFAKTLGLRPSAIELIKGDTSRLKQICVADLSAEAFIEKLGLA